MLKSFAGDALKIKLKKEKSIYIVPNKEFGCFISTVHSTKQFVFFVLLYYAWKAIKVKVIGSRLDASDYNL